MTEEPNSKFFLLRFPSRTMSLNNVVFSEFTDILPELFLGIDGNSISRVSASSFLNYFV